MSKTVCPSASIFSENPFCTGEKCELAPSCPDFSKKKQDPVKAPAHYAGDGKISCKRALRSCCAQNETIPQIQAYWRACAFKYIWRCFDKNGIQDVEKAIECLEQLKKEMGRK